MMHDRIFQRKLLHFVSVVIAASAAALLSNAAPTAPLKYEVVGAVANARGLLSFDEDDSLLMSDGYSSIVRLYLPPGTKSTFAGQPGQTGYKDGPATTTAMFNTPWSMAWNSPSRIIICDRINRRLRLLEMKSMIVSTFAGTGSSAVTDHIDRLQASFGNPTGIAVSPDGSTVYAIDCCTGSSHVVRRVRTGIDTIAGGGSAFANASLQAGSKLTFSQLTSLFVSRYISSSTARTTVATMITSSCSTQQRSKAA
jgi:hypothetical protein